MAYFPDLSPYAYGRDAHPGVVHVGWLDGEHSFGTGPVNSTLINKMKLLATTPTERYRGRHLCEVCIQPPDVAKTFVPDRGRLIDPTCSWARWAESRLSNGEIRVSRNGVVFAAPILIVHYIEEHGYLPPIEFLHAVDDAVCLLAPSE